MPDPARLARRTITFTARRRNCTRLEAAGLVREVITSVICAIGHDAPDLDRWLAAVMAAVCHEEILAIPAAVKAAAAERTPPP